MVIFISKVLVIFIYKQRFGKQVTMNDHIEQRFGVVVRISKQIALLTFSNGVITLLELNVKRQSSESKYRNMKMLPWALNFSEIRKIEIREFNDVVVVQRTLN